MKFVFLSLIFFSQNLWAINYENLEKCFRNTNWGRSLDANVANQPTARFFNDMQIQTGSRTDFDPNLLVVPVVSGNYTDIHLIQYKESSGWFGSTNVEYKPKTIRVSNSSLSSDCNNNRSVVSIGGACTIGTSESCPMGNLNIGVTSPERGSWLCADITRDRTSMNSRVQAQERPLTLADAEQVAKTALIQRLNFVREQIANGKMTGVEKNVTYAASGPCLNVFEGTNNAEVAAVSLQLLCTVSPTHQDCIQGDSDTLRPDEGRPEGTNH